MVEKYCKGVMLKALQFSLPPPRFFGFGTRTERFALSIVIASAYIHLAVSGFWQTVALEHSQLTNLLNVRGAVRGECWGYRSHSYHRQGHRQAQE